MVHRSYLILASLMKKLLAISIFFITACGPIANKGAQAINKTLTKSSKEFTEFSDNIIFRNINDTSIVAKDITEFNSYLIKNFMNDPNINYLYKIDDRYSQLPKDWRDEFEIVWQNSIKNNESYYRELYSEYFEDLFPNQDDFLSILPKVESVLIASIAGFSFTYTEESKAAEGGMISHENRKLKSLSLDELKKIQCSQAHDIVSIRADIEYSNLIKTLESCPSKKSNLIEIKKILKKM